jgi:hypothetical protein
LPIMIVVLFLNLIAACSSAATSVPTQAATATVTPVPPTPTKTAKPTSTPVPTATPNVAATQKYDEFNKILEDFLSKGYLATTEGKTVELDDFKEEWAKMNYYDFFPPAQQVDTDFLFKSHVKWSSASDTADISGCGVAFGVQESNGDHYMLVLDKSRIFFGMNRGSRTYQVGKTSGSGRLDFDNPAEADMVVAVKDKSAFVSVNGEVTEYTLSQDQTTHGIFAFSLLSGTNKDYGTRCEMTDNMLWTASK